jgi:hypothetical protein
VESVPGFVVLPESLPELPGPIVSDSEPVIDAPDIDSVIPCVLDSVAGLMVPSLIIESPEVSSVGHAVSDRPMRTAPAVRATPPPSFSRRAPQTMHCGSSALT